MRQWWGRHRGTVLLVGAFLLAVGVVLLAGVGARTSAPLDPDNPGPGGARAVARVLADRGVDVEVARSADDLEALEVTPATTVLVVGPSQLGERTAERLLDHAGPGRLVVAGAGPGVPALLGSAATPSSVTVGGGRPADCADPLLAGLRVEADTATAYAGSGCFDGEGGALVQVRDGLLLLGVDQVLTNDQVLRADNAAVALRLLGQGDRLVWYVPTVDDLLGEEGGGVAGQLPRWLQPGLVVALLAVVGLVLWRGRRLGPLATEPLPVVVTAIETTRSRARLYRRAGDRAHAAAALRAGARARATDRLRSPDDATLVRDVARATGHSVADVAALLAADAPPPASDHDLITLAGALAELEREVSRA